MIVPVDELSQYENYTAYQLHGDKQDSYRLVAAYGTSVEEFLREKNPKIREIFVITGPTAPRS